jgi:translation initiation factor 3 subunit A
LSCSIHVHLTATLNLSQPVKDVFAALEGEFDPLQLCTRLGPLLDALPGLTASLSSAAPVEEADVGSHVAALKRVAIVKTLNQLSQVHQPTGQLSWTIM